MTLDFNTLELPAELLELKDAVVVAKQSRRPVISTSFVRKPQAVIAELQVKYKADLLAFRTNGGTKPTAPSFYEWKDQVSVDTKFESPFGIYLLNYVHALIHEYGYEYVGKQEDSYVFHMQRENWLHANKKTYDIFEEVLRINPSQMTTGYSLTRENNMPVLCTVNGKATYIEQEDLAKRLGKTTEELLSLFGDIWLIEERDPALYFTNIFPQITGVESGVYNGDIFINGLISDFYDIGSLTTSYNMKGRDYVVEWRLYNAGEVGDTTSLSSGNFGESFKRRFLKSDPKSKTITLIPSDLKPTYDVESHTLTYNPDKEQAILELYIEFMPAQGKNDSYSGYYNILTGEICQTLRG